LYESLDYRLERNVYSTITQIVKQLEDNFNYRKNPSMY